VNDRQRRVLVDRLASGEVVFGPFLKIPASVSAELAGYAGFDFCIIDLEHSPYSFERAEELVRAAEVAGVSPLIRTYDGEPSTLVRALDTGCEGVLVPNIKSRQQVDQVVRGARFFPQGERGMDPFARSARYGAVPKEIYFEQANRRTVVGVQVEGLAAIQNLDEIATVPGIDVVFVGPYDLSQSMGMPGRVDSPEVLAQVARVVERVRAAGKALGIYTEHVAEARRWRDLGIQLIALNVDVNVLLKAYRSMIESLNAAA
jgi:4-hydroxy-2-oxoheptanedioate aldolase